jgi:hypothetical protein
MTTDNQYEAGRQAFLDQLARLQEKIKAMPLPGDKTKSVKSWLQDEAWILEDAVWDMVDEVIEENEN